MFASWLDDEPITSIMRFLRVPGGKMLRLAHPAANKHSWAPCKPLPPPEQLTFPMVRGVSVRGEGGGD